MKKIKLLWKIFRSVGADKIIVGFVLFLLCVAYALKLIEPNIYTFGDGIWYCFSVVTTIGFGDYVAVTTLGRSLTIFLGIYGLLVVGLIPGILVSYFLEFTKIKADTSVLNFLDQLEHLDQLDKQELKELSNKIKARKYKI